MGSKFVIADPGLCIGCQTCMAGCLLKHSVPGDVAKPRLNLITTLTISAPIVCHHCADAPCVASCPEGVQIRTQSRQCTDESPTILLTMFNMLVHVHLHVTVSRNVCVMHLCHMRGPLQGSVCPHFLLCLVHCLITTEFVWLAGQ